MYTSQYMSSNSQPSSSSPYMVATSPHNCRELSNSDHPYRSVPTNNSYPYPSPYEYPVMSGHSPYGLYSVSYPYQIPQNYIMSPSNNPPSNGYQFVNQIPSHHQSSPPHGESYTQTINFPTHQLSGSSSVPVHLYPHISSLYQAIQVKKYATSALDPVRNYLTAYEYTINNQWIIWDYETGFVHLTGMWKAAETATRIQQGQSGVNVDAGPKSKADIVKLLDSTPKQYHQFIKRIRGGFLKIQGTWLPYNLCKILARRFCYNIRYELIPIFGNDFPEYCLTPNDKKFGELKFDDVEIARNSNSFDILEASQCLQSLGHPMPPAPVRKHQSTPNVNRYQYFSQPNYNQAATVSQHNGSQHKISQTPKASAKEKPLQLDILTPMKTDLKTPENVKHENKSALGTPFKYEQKSYFELPKSTGPKFELKTPNSISSGSPTFLKSPIAFQTGSFCSGSNATSLDKYSIDASVSPNYVITPQYEGEHHKKPIMGPSRGNKEAETGDSGRTHSISPREKSPKSSNSSPSRYSNGLQSLLIAADITRTQPVPSSDQSPCKKARKVSMKINDLLT